MANTTISISFGEGIQPLRLPSRMQSEISFDLGDKDVNKELALLCSDPSANLSVDKENRLIKSTGLVAALKRPFTRGTEEKVQAKVQFLISSLNNHLESKDEADREVYITVMRYFFSKQGPLAHYKHLIDEGTTLDRYLLPENAVKLHFGDSKFLTVIYQKFQRLHSRFPETIELGDQVSNHNLWMLLKRRKGESFYIDSEGCLQTLSSLRDRAFFIWNKSDQQQKIQQAVTKTIQLFDTFLGPKLKDPESQEIVKVYRHALKYFLNPKGTLGSLPSEVFDRGSINPEGNIARLLMPEGSVKLKIGAGRYINYISSQLKTIQDLPFILDLTLDSDETNHNLNMLMRRGKGTIFALEEGKFIPVSGHFWNKDHQDQIKEKITHVLLELEKNLNKQDQKGQDVLKVLITELFQKEGCMTRLSASVLDRGAIKEGSEIEKTLNQDLSKAREELVDAILGCERLFSITGADRNAVTQFVGKLFESENNQKLLKQFFNLTDIDDEERKSLQTVEKKFMNLTFAEFLFAQSLGIELKGVSDGGSGGARYAYDRFGHKILVIKPGDEGPHGINNPQWYARLKQLFVSPHFCLNGNSESLAEEDSYVMDRFFKFYIVPPTDLRRVESKTFHGEIHDKECSVQMFVKDCKPLADHLGVSYYLQNLPRSFFRWLMGGKYNPQTDNTWLANVFGRVKRHEEFLNKIPQDIFEKLVLHNFLTEDIDGHFGNALVLDDGRVLKHDGGDTHPHDHPDHEDYLSTRFKHLIEVLPQCDSSFSPDAKDLILDRQHILFEVLEEKATRAICNIIWPKAVLDGFWTKENSLLVKQWIFGGENSDLYDQILKALVDLSVEKTDLKTEGQKSLYRKKCQRFYSYHLKRIKKTIMTRIDSWKVLIDHLQTDKPIRDLLLIVSRRDFEEKLKSIKDQQCIKGFEKALTLQARAPVEHVFTKQGKGKGGSQRRKSLMRSGSSYKL